MLMDRELPDEDRARIVAIARNQQGVFAIGDGQQGLESTQGAVGAPLFGQFRGRARQVG